MRPGKRKTNDGDAKDDCGQQVEKREPPTREQKPDHIADLTEGAGTDILPAAVKTAWDRLLAKRQQRIDGDVDRSARPGDTNDGYRHDHRGKAPAYGRAEAAKDKPDEVQQCRAHRHGRYICM